jgi:SNF2 family DNA or RNA helicase
MSPGDYDQMMARQYRPGQTRDVIYYHLVAKKTVEEKLIKARQEKRDIVDALLMDLFDEDVF